MIHSDHRNKFITIISMTYGSTSSTSSSTAYHSQTDKGLSFSTQLQSIFDFSHPVPASHLAKIVTPPGSRASFIVFA